MIERKYYFYMHRNIINGKVYVGMTYQNPPENRWKTPSLYKPCIFFYRAIQKYGWKNFEHIILETKICDDTEAGIREQYWIDKMESTNPKYGYNLKPGGIGGFTPNAIQKSMQWMKEHPEFGLERANIMHKWQQEHPEEMLKMRKINIEKATNSRKRKVLCIETGCIYDSAADAARAINGSQSHICQVCRGQRNTSGGFHWRYSE